MAPRRRERAAGREVRLGWDQHEEPAAAGDASERPGGTRDDRPRRRRLLLALTAAAALVAALLVGLPRLTGAADGPEAVARDFLQAVVDGDLEAVRAHVETAPDASPAALTAEVLAGAEDTLRGFEILDVAVEAGSATVTASLATRTVHGEVTLALVATSAGAFSPLRWELEPVQLPELIISVPMGAEQILINGVAFDVTELAVVGDPSTPRAVVQLLPGRYEIALPAAGPWLEDIRTSVTTPPTFGAWRKPVDELRHRLSEAGLQEVQQQVDAALQECARSPEAAARHCPFPAPTGSGDASTPTGGPGTWRVESPAEAVVEPLDTYLWTLSGEGTARFTPDAAESGRAAQSVDVPFALDGAVLLDDDGALSVVLGDSASFTVITCVDAETGAFTGAAVIHDSNDPESWEACG